MALRSLLGAVGLAVVLSSSLVGPVATAGPAVVRPTDLPTGEPLRVAALDQAGKRLLLPDGTTVPVVEEPHSGLVPQTVTEIGAGKYLVTYAATAWTSVRASVVTSVGDVHWLPASSFAPAAVSTDGRTYVGVARSSKRVFFQRFDLDTGEPVGRPLRLAPSVHNTPVLVTKRRVLVAAQHKPYPSLDVRLEWWNTRTGKVTPFPRAGRQHWDTLAHTASAVAGVLMSRLKDRQTVVDLRTGRTLWRLGGGRDSWTRETGLTVSPDGRRLLTVDDAAAVLGYDTDTVKRLRVHDTRTGRLRADFTGYFEFGPGSLVWETSNSFLAIAHDAVTSENDGFYTGQTAVVRCRVSTGACENVPGVPMHARLMGRPAR